MCEGLSKKYRFSSLRETKRSGVTKPACLIACAKAGRQSLHNQRDCFTVHDTSSPSVRNGVPFWTPSFSFHPCYPFSGLRTSADDWAKLQYRQGSSCYAANPPGLLHSRSILPFQEEILPFE